MESMMEDEDTLIALTTHFAQVQFRLKQIIVADAQHKETLLRELEEFAFRGCVAKSMTYDTAASGENGSTEAQQQRRLELMEGLKDQLKGLEECAQRVEEQDGGEGAVEGDLAQKQRVIIEELCRRFNLQFGDLERISTEEVKENVSKAVRGMKSREDLVTQLTTQVSDLQRYITFLQKEDPRQPKSPESLPPPPPPLYSTHSSASPVRSTQPKQVSFLDEREEEDSGSSSSYSQGRLRSSAQCAHASTDSDPIFDDVISDSGGGVAYSVNAGEVEWVRREGRYDSPLYHCKDRDDLRLSLLVMHKTLSVMQVLTLWQCGGSFQCLPRYVTDGHRRQYHSALRCLEAAVDRIAILTTSLTDSNLSPTTAVAMETKLHSEVSMNMADSLRVLLEHGLINCGQGVGSREGCVGVWGRRRRGTEKGDCPSWRVFQYYYGLKNGRDHSTKPDQLLSSSFSLPITNVSSIKKTLLTAIYRVENTYMNCHNCTRDTKFRALVCEGFNLCHLAEWFRIVATHPSIAEDLYTSSSFLATTGFRPALACLENLKDNPSCEPVQLPSDYYHTTNVFQTNS